MCCINNEVVAKCDRYFCLMCCVLHLHVIKKGNHFMCVCTEREKGNHFMCVCTERDRETERERETERQRERHAERERDRERENEFVNSYFTYLHHYLYSECFPFKMLLTLVQSFSIYCSWTVYSRCCHTCYSRNSSAG